MAVFWLLGGPAGRAFDIVTLEAAAKLVLWGGTCLLATMTMLRATPETALRVLGLYGRVSMGGLVSVAATVPMAVVALTASRTVDPDLIAGNAIIGPLAEELLFRGFLFGLLVSLAGWRVSVAIVTSAIMFGMSHVRDADMVITALMRGPDLLGYAITSRGPQVLSIQSGTELWFGFLAERVPSLLARAVPLACGGAALAWITWRWRSLWPAIILHGLMNLWWELARPELMRTPSGFDRLAFAQILAVVLAVALTAFATRKKQRLD